MLIPSSQLIADRYQLLSPLGCGGSGFTYKAQDQETGNLVAVKAFSLTQLETWKQIELFEREAKILQQLHHPAIPQYLNHFQQETEGDYAFYIVQQLAPGQSLAALIEQGWQPQLEEVKQMAEQVLAILVDLQIQVPPVIHRDLKPQNLIYQGGEPSTEENGSLFLVDFGGVQEVYHQTAVGSTVVGSYGYMAPEQFRGQANLSTDLYGLAATLLFLLTGKPPSELPERNFKLEFRGQVKISEPFANWLERCLEPNPEHRFPCAEAALEVLQGQRPLSAACNSRLERPSDSVIALQEKEGKLTIEIPPARFRPRRDRQMVALAITWHLGLLMIFSGLASSIHFTIPPGGLGWLWLYAFASVFSFSGSKAMQIWSQCTRWLLLIYSLLIYSLIQLMSKWFSLNIIILSLLLLALDLHLGDPRRRAWLSDLFSTTRIELDLRDSQIRVAYQWPFSKTKLFKGKLEKVHLLKLNRFHPIRLELGSRSHPCLGVGGFLTRAEKAWLTRKINDFLDRH